ncbi:MAG: divergent polysaccharide deacetylase family protein [Geobacteraceae bacterium]|nr:divergent polysaccharide deacetylase family protein [Geobacteraceae bacterium]
MARSSHNNRVRNKPGGSRYAALAILAVIVIAVGAYLLFAPAGNVNPPASHVVTKSTPTVLPKQPPASSAHIAAPEILPQPEQLHPTKIAPPKKQPPHLSQGGGTGKLAIIIDDMGTSLQEARSLAGIGVPLTFSIIPELKHYREVAAFAAANGVDIMIHIPMQPKGWPERRLEANGLLLSMADKDIVEHLEGFMRTIPNAIGANNHMGSEFTEHEDKMRVVLDTLKGKGLFFVDSVTTPQSVGLRLAKELGMKSGRRNVFLDNEQDGTYILGQLNQAIRLAKRTGSAIAICHPHPATIQTLEAALPGLAQQGITLVPVSRLLR